MSETKGGGAKQNCPQCGKPAGGNFCQYCGTALGGRFCNKCGAKLVGATTYCNQCGAKAPAGGGGGAPVPSRREAAAAVMGGGNAPWWIAGVAMLVLILVVGWSMVRPQQQAAPAGMGGGAVDPNSAGTTDITQMSPREAADRLFDRVMRTISAGDTAGALGFQPMAVQAFEMVGELDLDGMFHLALLQQLSDPAAALATAKRMLEGEPDHILGLGMAGEAAAAMGDQAAAQEYFQHLLRVYDVQFARSLLEYDGHRNLMTQMKTTAEASVGR
ncbi:MAG TPA: zinc ribbon domain-containing protein [Longimicrobiales bacterium]|nr:zinc ribbon domain-containing protein [Longimicrobiales bacterium]